MGSTDVFSLMSLGIKGWLMSRAASFSVVIMRRFPEESCSNFRCINFMSSSVKSWWSVNVSGYT